MTSSSPPPRIPNAADTPRRWRENALLAGLVCLVVAGLAGLAAATGWDDTIAELRSLSAAQLFALLALSLVNYGLRAARWHIFANRLALPTVFWQNIRHFLGGFAMSVTPGRVGELVRMRWIRRETGWPFEQTAPLVLIDRAADLAAMALLLALALALSRGGVTGGVPVAVLAFGVAYVATRPIALKQVANLGHRLAGKRFPKVFARVRRAATALAAFRGPGLLMVAGVLGLVGWLAEGVAFHLLLSWMGADIGLWMAIAIFVFATIAGGLTGAPGGLGGAEAAMVGLLILDGVPTEIAVAATLVIRVTTLWFAILLGLIVFPYAERKSQMAAA